MITITDRAVREVRRIIKEQNLPEATALRVGVKGGGCSGFSYTLGFDDQIGEIDQVNEVEGVRVVCDPKSFLYLNGTTLDYEDTLMRQGFVFINPNAARNCGCGSSFTA